MAAVARRTNVTWLDHRRAVELVADGSGVHGVVDGGGVRHRAPLVVGADGRRSTVARLVDAPAQREHQAARILVYRYVTSYAGPDGAPGAEFSLCGNEMGYVFPSDNGTACVAVTVPITHEQEVFVDPEGFLDARLARHRGVWRSYRAAEPISRVVAGRPVDDYVRQPAGPGWALVGDAGVHQDPWSGMGMDAAARQARALADAVTGSDDWQTTYAAARDDVTLERYEETTAGADDLSTLE